MPGPQQGDPPAPLPAPPRRQPFHIRRVNDRDAVYLDTNGCLLHQPKMHDVFTTALATVAADFKAQPVYSERVQAAAELGNDKRLATALDAAADGGKPCSKKAVGRRPVSQSSTGRKGQ